MVEHCEARGKLQQELNKIHMNTKRELDKQTNKQKESNDSNNQ
jgi:type II secretory pathway component PulF